MLKKIQNMLAQIKQRREFFQAMESIDFKSCNIVFITGAGVSAESGLRTFRDQNGLWEGENINEICRPEAFEANPARVLEFYNARRQDFFNQNPQPNEAHLSLAKLEEVLGHRFTLITQNIDDLHEKAGNKRIIHVHGKLDQNRCHQCQLTSPGLQAIALPNHCPNCGAMNKLRPDVVFFKENLKYTSEVQTVLSDCQLVFVVGSSGVVYPVAFYPRQVQDLGGLSVCLNAEIPGNDSYFNHILLGKATALVPEIVQYILSRQ